MLIYLMVVEEHGKTSAAKILARAVNCLNPKDGEPCNECEICKGIISGTLTDVVEMDAASNNSVEDIRQIRDEVNFLPTLAKYRVYIIDEVHMLSQGAFNALLKTLEEPPKHVKFILATTEPQKIPATILSRCQRFEFKKIMNQDIIKRLKIISDESNIQITENALQMIASLAEGALRDAISILERCMQEENNKEITEDTVRDLVGIPKLLYINQIIENIIEHNSEGMLKNLTNIINEGKDLDNLIWELIKYTKDILLYKSNVKLELYSEEELEKIKKISNNISKERLLKIIYDLSEIANGVKWSSQKSIMLQTGLIKLCIRHEEIPERKVIREEIKEKKEEAITVKNIKEENVEPKKEIKQENIESGEYVSFWSNIIDNLRKNGKMTVYSNLINTKAKLLDENTLGIEFKNKMTDFCKAILNKKENKEEIEKLLIQETNKNMKIKYIENNSSENKQIKTENTFGDLPINIIDE